MRLEEFIKSVPGLSFVNEDRRESFSNHELENVADLELASDRSVCFFFSETYAPRLPGTKARVIVTAKAFVEPLRAKLPHFFKEKAILIHPNPYWAMAKSTSCFVVDEFIDEWGEEMHIHPSAIIHPDAQIGRDVRIGPHSVIGKNVILGDHVRIGKGCEIRKGACIGEGSVLFSDIAIYPGMQIGARARIHSGVRIGADGLGFAARFSDDGVPVEHEKIFHSGRVIIGNDVEIGANSCVDRGTFRDTIIEDQVKIDNLVQVAHNCHLKKGAVICGCCGLAGSCKIGSFAYLGGGVGVADGVEVGDYAKVGAYSLVTRRVPAGTSVMGNPQRDAREYFRANALLSKLLKERSGRRSRSASSPALDA